MSYLNESGLARYDGLLKNWVTFKSGTVDGVEPLLNWQKTDTAGAVTFYPLPAAPIDPVINFLFTETGPASGTKSPDNPSTITGVSSVKVTRCGKNLVPPPLNGTAVRNGVTFVVADGVFVATGTAGSGNAALYIATATGKDLRVVQGHTYCMSGCPAGGSSSTYYINANIYDDNGNAIAYNILRDYGSGATYTAPSNGWLTVYIGVVSGVEVSGLVFKPQIEDSTSATVFEPSESTVYTIDLGGTYYGGSVDLSAGTMTVTHVMVEPDSLSVDISAHPANATDFQYTDTFGRTVTTDGNTLTITGETGGQIVYKLATPETVSLTPLQIYSLSQPDPYTPRLNTVYSDQTSVQVGYPKSPIATASELTNAIVSLGSNL